MRRFLSVMFLTVVALFMLSAITFAEGYNRPADCPYNGQSSKGSKDNCPMPLTGKNKGGKSGKGEKKEKGNKKGKKGKKGKGNGKNGSGKGNGKNGNGKGSNGNNSPKTPRAK